VKSVNGQGGVVTLTAKDVGALEAGSADYVERIELNGQVMTLTMGDGSTRTLQTKDTTALDVMTGVLGVEHGGTGKDTALTAEDVGAYGKNETYAKTEVYSREETYSKTEVYSQKEADAKFGTPYSLPAATVSTLGGVKVGDYLDVDEDGTLSGKTLNDKIAAAVAVKSEARLVWSGKTTIGRKKTQTINVQDGVDYVNLRINEADFNLTPGMTYETGSFGAGSLTVTVLFSADKKRLECTLTNTLNTVSVVFTGYHYPTLAELLTETQSAQADTDALAVDQEYRVAMLELGLTDDTTTDTTA
jgi:ribosomal protein S24E